MVFKYNSGFSVKGVSAQEAGEELARLREANGGNLTPAVVVEASRHEDAVLHAAFEWRDDVAAQMCRDDQARRLIRNVYVVHLDSDGRERPVLGYVNVTLPDEGRCYVTTARAVSDADLRQQMEANALRELEALRARYQHIRDLATIFDDAIAKVRRRRPNRRPEVAQDAR